METQPQTAAADYRHPGDMAHHVQQLQQAGFDDGQVRALASFVSDLAGNAMRPFIERVEQRFDEMQLRADQRHDEANQRLGDMNQRLGDMQKYADQQFDGMNQRLGDMQKYADQQFDGMNQRLGDMQRYVDQQFFGVNQRLGDMQQHANQRLDRVGTRLDSLERHTGRLDVGVARLDAKVEDVRRREWMPLIMMGLGFAGLVLAVLLATGVIG